MRFLAKSKKDIIFQTVFSGICSALLFVIFLMEGNKNEFAATIAFIFFSLLVWITISLSQAEIATYEHGKQKVADYSKGAVDRWLIRRKWFRRYLGSGLTKEYRQGLSDGILVLEEKEKEDK